MLFNNPKGMINKLKDEKKGEGCYIKKKKLKKETKRGKTKRTPFKRNIQKKGLKLF